jgi:hypothetical protein
MPFTEFSATAAIANLQNPSTASTPQPCFRAKFLNMQVKAAFKLIYQGLLSEVLEGLDRAYEKKDMISYAICFCTILILCMIVEELQIGFDGMVIVNISHGDDPAQAVRSGTTCSRELDQVLTEYYWPRFFNMHRKYNPIKDRCPQDDGSGQSRGMADLFTNICEIIHDHGNRQPLSYSLAHSRNC